MQFQKLSDCIQYYQANQLTQHKYQYRADNLLFFSNYDLQLLKRHHIKEYCLLRSMVVSNATINRELSFAKAAINCVNYDYEIDIHNPFSNFKLIEKDYIPNYLTRYQYEKLLKTSLDFDNQNLHDFIKLSVMTGCRPKELLTLKSKNVFINKRQFVVRNFFSKSKKTMYKYLNDEALKVMKTRLDDDYVFFNHRTNNRYKSFSRSFSRCAQRANIKCKLYDLRHTYASWLVQKKVPIFTVKELLCHGDIVSTMRYAHLDYQSKIDALQKIN